MAELAPSNAELLFLLLYVVVVIAAAILPLFTVLRMGSRMAKQHAVLQQSVYEDMKSASFDQKIAFLNAASDTARTLQGRTRLIMTMTLFVILAIAVFHVMVFGAPEAGSAESVILTTILGMLASLLSAVAGFYFGSRGGSSPAAVPVTEVAGAAGAAGGLVAGAAGTAGAAGAAVRNVAGAVGRATGAAAVATTEPAFDAGDLPDAPSVPDHGPTTIG